MGIAQEGRLHRFHTVAAAAELLIGRHVEGCIGHRPADHNANTGQRQYQQSLDPEHGANIPANCMFLLLCSAA